jgi:hydrogenase expression/formation protein HypD
MKYLDEFRNADIAKKLADDIHRQTTRPWAIMEVCGGQTHSIIRHGITRSAVQHRAHSRSRVLVCVTPLDVIDRRWPLPVAQRHLLLVRGHAPRAR